MNPEYARLLVNKVRHGLTGLAPDITELYVGRAWEALGYADWPELVEAEFGGPLRLARADRQESAARLREGGMSTPAIAEALGVSDETIRRDLSGSTFVEPEYILGLDGKQYPATRPEAAKWNPGAIMSSDSVEWYTPSHILDAAVVALGGIDLDPCSNADRTVPATTHYTVEDDGLSHGWRGRVYMNPPYGREIGDWIEKLAVEYEMGNVTEAVALVPARTDTAWWGRLAPLMSRLCLVRGRLSFSGADPAPFPSAAIYLGLTPQGFDDAFGALGWVHPGVVQRLVAVAAA